MRFGLPASVFLSLFAYLVSPSPSLAGNILNNPGFETGDFGGWTVVSPTSFSAVSTSGENPPLAPHTGTYYAFLGDLSTDPGSLSQAFDTVVGHSYTFSFWLAVSSGGRYPPINQIVISWNNTALRTLNNLADSPYVSYSYTVRATTARSVIKFDHQFNDPYGWALDDVSVVDLTPPSVPEPGTWVPAVSALALGLTVGVRHRRRALSVA